MFRSPNPLHKLHNNKKKPFWLLAFCIACGRIASCRPFSNNRIWLQNDPKYAAYERGELDTLNTENDIIGSTLVLQRENGKQILESIYLIIL